MWPLTYCSWSHSFRPQTNLNVISHPGYRQQQSTLVQCVYGYDNPGTLFACQYKQKQCCVECSYCEGEVER